MSSWRPYIFNQKGLDLNYNQEFLKECLNVGNAIYSNKLPVIFSLKHLADILGISFTNLLCIVKRESVPWKIIKISKSNGGYRRIVIPKDELQRILRFIHQNILTKLPYHNCSTAYAPEASIYKNASIHCGSKWLIKIDIVKFFESISEKQIFYCFKKLGYSPRFSYELAKLTTVITPESKRYKSRQKRWVQGNNLIGYLPQGFATSPLLANLVCYNMDEELSNLALINGLIYTRYSDDMTFSTQVYSREKAQNLIRSISQILSKYGFVNNHRKSVIIPPGARKIVTGLIVNNENPTIKAELKDIIRLHLYYSKKYGVTSHCAKVGFRSIIGFRNHLLGLINYVKSVDNKLGEKYYGEFENIDWLVPISSLNNFL